ncbi:MAG: 30S ribosomal protein S2 [Candidatus Doudnabacteria bacterium]
MKDVSLPELLKSGAHFGHTTSRWNPKMRPYIFTVRNNIHIMDLEKTRAKLLDAMAYAKEVASKGGYVLFVATKRQSKDVVKAAAISAGMPYVITRWLGGTFTNFRTIQKSIKKMERYESLKASGEVANYTKKEGLMMERELTKMRTLFEGIKDMRKLPEAIIVFDVKHDEIALTEAQKSKVKVIAVVDTNGSPDKIDYVIPANDDAIKAVELVAEAMAEAINEGKKSFVPVQTPINAVNTPKPAAPIPAPAAEPKQ